MVVTQHHKQQQQQQQQQQPQDRNHPRPPHRRRRRAVSIQRSRSLSWALRHAAPELGLTMTADGYVPVQELLDCVHPKLKDITTLEMVQEVVANNDKQRFKLERRPGNKYGKHEEKEIWCVRANQGHSLSSSSSNSSSSSSIIIIDPEQLLTPLSSDEVLALPCIVHGTYDDAWTVIQTQGLHRMTRTHIHFATGLPNNENDNDKVISGMRSSSTVRIYLDAKRCCEDGIRFYASDNGVILTDGMDGGVLPPRYFSHVTDASGNVVLLDQRN